MARVHDVARFSTPPEITDLEAFAREAFATIPTELRQHLGDVVIQVEEFPDDDVLDEMECESPFDLLGLYCGVDLTQKSVSDVPEDVDMIFLYRRPILDYWCESGDDLVNVVRHVLIHEIGHHFGFSDDDMERLEAEI
jgi:predicted Zn-dependent protease with MMP-like domain